MLIYDYQPTHITEEQALDVARQDVLCDTETTEQAQPRHSRHIETIRGVGVWYDFGADYYFFTDEVEA